MTEDVLVSITVPVYNVQPYLCQCLDSILSQTYSRWECILIDDGSTDGSGRLCDDYAARDSRFIVIHRQNGGLASARKCAIDHSCGKYIVAVDSDDWVDADHIEKMVDAAESTNSDIVLFDFYVNTERSQQIQKCKPASFEKNDLLRDVFLHRIHAGVVLKIFSRSMSVANDIKEAPCGYYEDMFTFVSCLYHAKKISYSPIATYHYRYNHDSMTNNRNREKRYRMFRESMVNLEQLSELCDFKSGKAVYESFCHGVNICRGEIIVDFCLTHPIDVYRLLHKYNLDTCSLRSVKDKESLYMYLAVHFGFLLPYQLRVLKTRLFSK